MTVRLTIVGTGHVFRIGDIVAEIITRRSPHVVCVELDPVRLTGLQERARLNSYEEAGDPRAQAMRRAHEDATKRMPRLYRFLAKLQERLADQQGVEAGSEMLAAVEAANRIEVPVATIDVDAQDLIRRAWKAMSWKERGRFLWAIMRGRKGDQVESELEEYQEDPVAYLARVGDEFPTLKRVLIDERDAHMANHVIRLHDLGIDEIQRLATEQKARAQTAAENPDTAGTGNDPDNPLPAHKEKDDEAGYPAKSHGNDASPATDDPETDDGKELVIVAVVGDGHVPGMLEILQKRLPERQIETIRVGDLRAGLIPEAAATGAGGRQSGDAESVSLAYNVEHHEPPEHGPPGA